MSRVFSLILLPCLLISCSVRKEKIVPAVKSITESVYSSVTVQPDSAYQVYAAIRGILESNLVEEGDLVKKGTTLIQVINTNPKINAENARLSMELAQKNFNGNAAILKGIEVEIEAAKLMNLNDSINFFRQKNLWEQQIGSKAEFDAKKLSYELSKNKLTQLRDTYSRTKEDLKTHLQQARNNYATSLVSSGDYTIESKINGKVYALYKNPGELVNTIEPIALVGSVSTFLIEMLVDEVDIVKIKKGQEVLVTLDAYHGEVFKASVLKIYPKKDERNQTFIVEALFESPPEVLYPGLAGEANIVIDEKKEALTIPKQYLIDGDKVLTSEGIIPIKVGLESLDMIEVLSGISDSTAIYKPEE